MPEISSLANDESPPIVVTVRSVHSEPLSTVGRPGVAEPDQWLNAQAKLAAKRCDLVVANDVSEPGAGFGVDTNRVTVVDHRGVTEIPPGTKAEVAHRILDRVVALQASTRRRRR